MTKIAVTVIGLLLNVTLCYADGLIYPVNAYAVTGYKFAEPVGSTRHLGEDIKLDPGTPVRAMADGNIVYSRQNRPGYGQYIVITHTNPIPFVSVYGHLSRKAEWPMRSVGSVKQGEIIGYVGTDEENGKGGPHLHLGVYKAAHVSGEYHYWGYSPNDTNDDVDVAFDGTVVGGLLTKPSVFISTNGGQPLNRRPVGSLDGTNTLSQVFGWAKDPDDENQPIKVHLYIDKNAGSLGATAIEITANESRTDVGNHAFNWEIPPTLRDGQLHRVWAWGIDATEPASNNAMLSGSPIEFRIGAPVSRPIAVDDSYSIGQGGTLTVAAPGILSNDTYPNAATIEFLSPFPPASLTNVSPYSGGFILDMRSNPSFVGTINLRYVIRSSAGDSNVGNVAVRVEPEFSGQLFVSDDGGESWRSTPGLPLTATVYSIAVAPSRPTTLYAGTEEGVFKSTDGGSNWTAVRTGTWIFSIVVDPANPDIVYALGFGGMYRSIDGGAQWTITSLPSVQSFLDSLAIEPIDSNRLYIATSVGLFGSVDAGVTWNQIVITGRPPSVNLSAVVVDSAGATVYVGVWNSSSGAKSADRGTSWIGMTGGYDMAVAGDGTVYAVSAELPSAYIGIRKIAPQSTVGVRINNGFDDPTFGNFNVSLGRVAVSPIDPNIAYASFTDSGGTSSRLYRTVNGGTSWQQLQVVPAPSEIGIQRIVIDPSNPNRIYLAGSKHLIQ